LERLIEEATRDLETSTATLRAVTEKFEEAKKENDSVKAISPGFKNALKSLTTEEYQRIMSLITSTYNLSQIVSDIETSLSQFAESKKQELENYKNQMSTEEENISLLSAKLKELQTKLNVQRALVEELKSYMSMSQEESLSLSKKQVFDLLSKFIDENNHQVFAEAELSAAANLVMFRENFNLEQNSGKKVKEIFADAFSQADLEPVEEVTSTTPLIEAKQMPLEPIKLPTVVASDNTAMELKPIPLPVASMNDTDKLEPVTKASGFGKVIPFPTKTREEALSGVSLPDAYGPLKLDFVDFNEPVSDEEEVDNDPKLNELLNYLESSAEEPTKKGEPLSISHTPDEEKRYVENSKIIQSLGLKGDIKKTPVTFYSVTPKEVEDMIELASSYGIKLRTIEDLAILCRTKNIESLLNERIEKLAEGLGGQSVSNVIAAADAFGKGAKSTNHALKEYLGNNVILEALKDVVDNVKLGSAGYINLINFLGMLDDNLEKNAYTYNINNHLFSKKRVESVLTKLLASDIKITDEELLLIALTYDSQLGSSEQIASVDNELHARINASKGRTLGGMAA
jgi:uncharacterized coiled-coil protein SlyX